MLHWGSVGKGLLVLISCLSSLPSSLPLPLFASVASAEGGGREEGCGAWAVAREPLGEAERCEGTVWPVKVSRMNHRPDPLQLGPGMPQLLSGAWEWTRPLRFKGKLAIH